MSKKLSKEAYAKELTGESMPEVIETEEEKRILCILGTAGSRNKAPWNDPRCEFWGVAHCLLLQDIPKLDKVFEIHLPYVYNDEPSPYGKGEIIEIDGKKKNLPIIYHANKEHACGWREKKDIGVITAQHDPNLNKVDVFPREELKKKYKPLLPVSDSFYATNSIAWMILLGIEQGFDEIHLYGIHLETDSEWQFERPCNEWWLGVFAGIMYERGIEGVVHIPEESDVLRGYHEYGFADIEVRRKKIQGKLDFFNKNCADLQNQRSLIVNELNKLNSEKAVPVEDKLKWLSDQVNLMTREIDKINSMDKEEYKRVIQENITKRMGTLEMDLKNLDARLNAFSGAKEQVNYFLKELNA